MGVLCYRLIHCVAKKGLNWSHTLDELLAAADIQLDVPDSEGLLLLHKYYWKYYDRSLDLSHSITTAAGWSGVVVAHWSRSMKLTYAVPG